MSIDAKGGVRAVLMEAVVMGPCKHCGEGAQFWPDHPECEHEPTFTRDLGTVARWHKSPIVRAAWRRIDKRKRGT